jgi:hypothetical protein
MGTVMLGRYQGCETRRVEEWRGAETAGVTAAFDQCTDARQDLEFGCKPFNPTLETLNGVAATRQFVVHLLLAPDR